MVTKVLVAGSVAAAAGFSALAAWAQPGRAKTVPAAGARSQFVPSSPTTTAPPVVTAPTRHESESGDGAQRLSPPATVPAIRTRCRQRFRTRCRLPSTSTARRPWWCRARPESMLPPITFAALGTTVTLLVAEDRARDDARAILAAEIEAIDAACSRFRDDSELARVNANAGTWIPVSARFLEALEVARRGAVLTDGRVDPTVGAVMRVLGYDRDFGDVDRDGPPLRVSVERVPGWQTIEVDPDASTVLVPKGVELDFGATAKGLCADRAARAIADVTGAGVLVSLGGDIAIDGPEREAGWVVLVTDDHAAVPGSAELDGLGQRITVRAGGVATSGTTVRRWRRGEIEVHHVVDPRTGLPAAEHWRTVSVAAASCVDANIASTASIVLGAEAPAWLGARKLPARLVARGGEVVTVGGWPAAAAVPC